MLKAFADSLVSRRNLLRCSAFTGLATALSPALLLAQEDNQGDSSGCGRRCKENPPPKTPAEAVQALINGNERWATFKQCHPHEDRARRMAVVNGQSPFAAILSCSDSRVPPELVFDQGIGDLFVGRVAGNCAEGTLTESLYYGTKDQYLGALILFVLGHSDCGAVIAATKSFPSLDTFQFATLIYPAIRAAIAAGGNPSDPATFVPLVTKLNVILGVGVLQADPELEGLLITGGVYDLATSQVNIPEELTQ
jgi:carbonic anhydrase